MDLLKGLKSLVKNGTLENYRILINANFDSMNFLFNVLLIYDISFFFSVKAVHELLMKLFFFNQIKYTLVLPTHLHY